MNVTAPNSGAADRTTTATASSTTDSVAQSETVPVSMSTAKISTSYNTQAIQYMPQPNYLSPAGTAFGAYNLSLLSEGVTSGGVGLARGPAVGGVAPTSNNFHVDGIDNNNKVLPGPLVYVPNEATSDFSLQQAQPSPLFGHAAGGQMNSAIRTGSNQVHGALYWYLQNREFNAMDPGLQSLGLTENPRYDQNRLGASLGMPIVPSKVFFFGNFEYIPLGFTRVNRPGVYAPTGAGLVTLAGLPGVSSSNLGILRNTLGAAATGTRTATVGGSTIPLGLISSSASGFQNQYIGTGAVDWNPNSSAKVQARYVHNEFETNGAGTASLPGFLSPMQGKSLLATVAYQQNVSAYVTNELRLGYNRFANTVTGSGDATFPGLSAFPNVSIQGLNLGLGPQLTMPDNATVNTYHVADALAVRTGPHQWRFGIDARRYVSSLFGFPQSRGSYTYSSLERFLLDLPPDVSSQRAFGGSFASNNQDLWFGYIQDTWQVRRNLTVDLGVRYQYASIPQQFRQQEFNGAASVPGLLEFNTPTTQNRNFAPQAGFAYSPGDRTVFRGGFSMNYDALYGQSWMNTVVPGFGYTTFGNLQSNTAGFFRNGGLNSTFVPQADLTAAQTRARVTSYIANQEMPYIMHWNAGIQQALWRSFTMEAKYIGSRGIHLPVMSYLNVTPGVTADQSLPVYQQQPAQSTLNALTLTQNQLLQPVSNAYTQAGFTSPITTFRNEGSSMYHGAAITLSQRFAGGLQVRGNYTYSHLIDDTTGTALDLTAFGRERANSIYDRRHRAIVTGNFDVWSLLSNNSNWLGHIVANLSLAGTYTYESGQYLTALSGLDSGLGTGVSSRVLINQNAMGNAGTDVSPLRNAQGQVVAYLANDPNARFIRGAQGVFAFGGRNSLQLADTNNFDVSAVKRFSFLDNAAIELRADAFNVLNRRQYTGGSLTSIDFRNTTAAQAFFIPGTPEFNNAAALLPANNRTLQFALRVTF